MTVATKPLTPQEEYWTNEDAKCANNVFGFLYFINNHCKILHEDKEKEITDWLPFKLWPAQAELLMTVHNNKQSIALKARQVGITWIILFYALWNMIVKKNYRVGFWSYQDRYAKQAVQRLKGIIRFLPPQLKPEIIVDNAHELKLANGSVFTAYNPNTGDGETNNLAIIDECELIKDLGALMGIVYPTIGDIGKLVLISRIDKEQADTYFRRTWKNAIDYARLFIGWFERPDRDDAWYETTKQRILSTEKAGIDMLYSHYPATPEQALAPASVSKAIPLEWLQRCYKPLPPLPVNNEGIPEYLRQYQLFYGKLPIKDVLTLHDINAPSINGLEIYKPPIIGRRVIVTIDYSEGNPNSDDTSITVYDEAYKEELAGLLGKFTPAIASGYAYRLFKFYGGQGGLLPERNNHGHAGILWFENFASGVNIMYGDDGKKGWLTNAKTKTKMYDVGTEEIRQGLVTIHSELTFNQLAMIDGSDLSAEDDDRAITIMLAINAAKSQRNAWEVYTKKSNEPQYERVYL